MRASIRGLFQPIHFLKPRPSAASSPCIHPPGRAAELLWPRHEVRWTSLTGFLRQKTFIVQPLTIARPAVAAPAVAACPLIVNAARRAFEMAQSPLCLLHFVSVVTRRGGRGSGRQVVRANDC